MKKFVVLVGAMTDSQEVLFRDYITANGWGFWHWLPGSWLIETHGTEDDACGIIRDKLIEVAPVARSFVFEATGISPDWAGFGPQTDGDDMFQWINQNWKT